MAGSDRLCVRVRVHVCVFFPSMLGFSFRILNRGVGFADGDAVRARGADGDAVGEWCQGRVCERRVRTACGRDAGGEYM